MMAEKLNVKFHTMIDLKIQESEISYDILNRFAKAFNMNITTVIALERILREYKFCNEGYY